MALAEAGALPLAAPLAVPVAESLFELCGRVSNKSSTNETNAAIVPYLVWRDHPMSANTKQGNETEPATRFAYGGGKWWESTIRTYAAMKMAMKGSQTEQNHLVHAAFFRKGPPETRHLVQYVPAITLSKEEHRGPKFSYHKMKDGERVATGRDSFHGCGMDAYLLSEGIDVNKPHFTFEEVGKAIDASADYWAMIGLDHATEAVRQFKRDI
jgi:hypothetical protein